MVKVSSLLFNRPLCPAPYTVLSSLARSGNEVASVCHSLPRHTRRLGFTAGAAGRHRPMVFPSQLSHSPSGPGGIHDLY